jgi:SAM-dependent methyltransferase
MASEKQETKPGQDAAKFWDEMAVYGPDASVIDPGDTRGHKNRYIASIRNREILKHLAGCPKPSSVLDFGCGTGNITHFLRSQGHDCFGLDIAGELLRQYFKQHNASHLIQYGGEKLPFLPSSFDAVVNYGVMVCIKDDEQLIHILKSLNDSLKPGGVHIAVEQTALNNIVGGAQDKKIRSIPEWKSMFLAAGYQIESVELVRSGHFPLTYLVRYGLIPEKFFHLLAKIEKIWAKPARFVPAEYQEAVFVLKKAV